MDTIFMNSENSKKSEPHILKLKLTDKLDLRIGEKVIALSNLSIYYTWKNIKNSYNNNKFKNVHYQVGLIQYLIFRITLNIYYKSIKKIQINPQYRYILIRLKIESHLK